MKIFKTIVLLTCFIALTTTTAFANKTMIGNAMGIMQQIADLADEFNLTDQQRSDIRGVVFSYAPVLAYKANAMMNNRQLLIENNLGEDQVDEVFLQEIADRQGELLSQIIVTKEHMKKEIRNKLTSEQKDFVDELFTALIQFRLAQGS